MSNISFEGECTLKEKKTKMRPGLELCTFGQRGVSIGHCVRYGERTKMGYFVIIYIRCKFNTCTFSIDFLPCPRPVNWLVYRLCSNQVLLLAQFWH